MTKSVDVPESWICLCHRAAARVDESPPFLPSPMLPTKHSSSNELPFNHVTLYTRDRCGVIYHVHRRDCVICLLTTFRPPISSYESRCICSPPFLKFVILRCMIRPPTHPAMSAVFNVAARVPLSRARSHFKNLHLRETKPSMVDSWCMVCGLSCKSGCEY